LEADLVAAALDGAQWPTLLGRLAAAGRAVRLLDMTGSLLAASDATVPAGLAGGSTAVAVAALLLGPSLGRVVSPAIGPVGAPIVCRDGWRGHGGPVRMCNRYLGVLLVEADPDHPDHPDPNVRPASGARPGARPGPDTDSAAVEAGRLVTAAATALAIVAVRREAHAAALARGVDAVIDDIRYGAIRPAAEFVRVAESFGLDVRIPHAGVALYHLGTDPAGWESAWGVIGFPVLRDGDRAWTLLSGDVPAELGRLCRHLAFQLGSPRAVLAAAGPVVPGEPVDPAETAASFRTADAVLALLRHRHEQDRDQDRDQDRTMLLFDELGLERLLLSVPAARLRAFAQRTLAGLDPAGVDLLTAWLETDGSVGAVAERVDCPPARLRRRLSALVDEVAGPAATTDRLADLHAAALAQRITAMIGTDA
jgi:hypothetical protein